MKILATLTLNPDVPSTGVGAHLIEELRGSWSLYAAGSLREVYATELPTRVVFVLETSDSRSAAEMLGRLPMVAAGSFKVEIMELRPFVNWARLFAR